MEAWKIMYDVAVIGGGLVGSAIAWGDFGKLRRPYRERFPWTFR